MESPTDERFVTENPPIQKYKYSPVNVRKSTLKCGNNVLLDELIHCIFDFNFIL